MLIKISMAVLILTLTGCATTRAPITKPVNVENVCHVLQMNPDWLDKVSAVESRWDLPAPVMMAIINQESGFAATARPPRTKVLGVLPIGKPISTAYGYSQALDGTWQHYEMSTNRQHAKRELFEDATDFIGWYTQLARKKLGIAKDDAYNLYLAYHEGLGGFAKQSYNQKPWLLRVANRVKERALTYKSQWAQCGIGTTLS